MEPKPQYSLDEILEQCTVSKSAKKAYDLYKKAEGKIRALNLPEDEEIKKLIELQEEPEFNPLFIELEYWNVWHEANQKEELFYRDKDNELRATDKNVEIHTKKVYDALHLAIEALKNKEKIEKEMKTPLGIITTDQFLVTLKEPSRDLSVIYPSKGAEIILFSHILNAGELVYNVRGLSLLNSNQKLIIAETVLNVHKSLLDQRPQKTRYSYYYQKADNIFNILLQPYHEILSDTVPLTTLGQNNPWLRTATPPEIRHPTTFMLNKTLLQQSNGEVFYKATEQEKEFIYIIFPKDIAHRDNKEGIKFKPSEPCEEALEIIKNLGIETAILHIHFAGYCMAKQDPTTCYAIAEADKLIEVLHLNKRTVKEGGKNRSLTREEKLNKLLEYINSLQSIYVTIQTKKGNKNRIIEKTGPTPLWDLAIGKSFQPFQKELYDPEEENLSDFRVYIRAGAWAMSERGNREHMLYTYMSNVILDFDYGTENWALKIAVYTAIHAGTQRQCRRTVRKLLEDILIDPKKMELALNGNGATARRTRYDITTKLINHLSVLEKHGWKIERSREFIDATKRTTRTGRPRDFFSKMLDSTLVFYPPSPSKELPPHEQKQLETIHHNTKAITFSPKGEEQEQQTTTRTLTGRDLRDQRTKLGLSQKEVAHILGKSRSTITMIERGQRTLSEEDIAKWEQYYTEQMAKITKRNCKS